MAGTLCECPCHGGEEVSIREPRNPYPPKDSEKVWID